jgi:cell division protein FtsZ
MKGARAVLVNVTGGPDLMLFEVDEAVNRIRAEVDPDANILFGSALSETMEGRVRVSVVATGIDAEIMRQGRGSNVEKLNVRRKPVDVELPVANALSRAHYEPLAASAVHQHVANLAQEFTQPAIEAPLAAAARAVEEPLMLGGADSPALDDLPPIPPPSLRAFAREPTPAEPRERRGMFGGLFGGRKRAERIERPEPSLEAPRMPAMQQIAPTPVERPAPQPAPAPQPQPAAARTEQRPQPQAPADDLFAGVEDSDHFEIPAFLRRQAKTGS